VRVDTKLGMIEEAVDGVQVAMIEEAVDGVQVAVGG
jgi:hypothetical protein